MSHEWLVIQPFDEEVEILESEQTAADDIEVDDDPEPEAMASEVDSSNALTFLEGEEMLAKLKANCNNWGVDPQATAHLDRFGRALQAAKGKKATKKKATTIETFFSKKK